MTVLAIDIGTSLGWFLGPGAGVGPVEHGTFKLTDTSNLGQWLASSDEFFQTALKLCTSVAVEKPNTGGNSAYYAIRKNMCLLGHLHWHCRQLGLPEPVEISVATGKLTLAGHGHADKEMMIAAAAADGYEGMDEHQADAYGIYKVFVYGAREPLNRRPKNSKVRIIK